MESNLNRYGKYRCPCCKYYTLNEQAGHTFQLFPVCYSEDDGIQLNDPDYKGGANNVGLNQARKNFQSIDVIDSQFEKQVRFPTITELSIK